MELEAVRFQPFTCFVEVNAVSLDGVSNGSWMPDLLFLDFYEIFVVPHAGKVGTALIEFLRIEVLRNTCPIVLAIEFVKDCARSFDVKHLCHGTWT